MSLYLGEERGVGEEKMYFSEMKMAKICNEFRPFE